LNRKIKKIEKTGIFENFRVRERVKKLNNQEKISFRDIKIEFS
jgi:hypothetical protein